MGCCGNMDVVKRILILVLILTSLVLLIITSLYISKANLDKSEQVCVTDECIRSSGYILNMMKYDVEPCEDLYSFSCGRWIKNRNATMLDNRETPYSNFLLNDEVGKLLERSNAEQDGQIVTSIEKAKLYLHNCQNETDIELLGVEPVKQMIADLQGWSIGDDNWSNKSWNFLEALALNHKIGGSAFFTIIVKSIIINVSLAIDPPPGRSLTLRDKSDYSKNDTLIRFTNFVEKIVFLLGGKQVQHNKIMDLFQFEKQIANISTSSSYDLTKLSQLTELVGNKINFTLLVAELGGKPQPKDYRILAYATDYLKQLKDLLADTPDEVLANYIVLNSIVTMIEQMPRDLVSAYESLFDSEPYKPRRKSRWECCVSATKTFFPWPLTALYALKNFPISSKREVERMVEDIREELIESISKLDWMDAKTKSGAIEKVKNVQKVIGYHDWILDWDQLDKYYNKSHVMQNHYFENKINLQMSKWEKDLEILDHPFDINELVFQPLSINAVYSIMNFLTIMVGYLPAYDKIFPFSYTFGSLGSIIGHEFTHGFDNRGHKHNSEGNLHNWWSNDLTRAHETKTKCIEDQYNNFNESGITINGTVSLNENIADIGGVAIAYRAYQKRKAELKEPFPLAPGLNLTHDQLFFVGLSQDYCIAYKTLRDQKDDGDHAHAPGMFRVLGSVSNMKAFSDVYGCGVDAKYNPPKKCTFW